MRLRTSTNKAVTITRQVRHSLSFMASTISSVRCGVISGHHLLVSISGLRLVFLFFCLSFLWIDRCFELLSTSHCHLLIPSSLGLFDFYTKLSPASAIIAGPFRSYFLLFRLPVLCGFLTLFSYSWDWHYRISCLSLRFSWLSA